MKSNKFISWLIICGRSCGLVFILGFNSECRVTIICASRSRLDLDFFVEMAFKWA